MHHRVVRKSVISMALVTAFAAYAVAQMSQTNAGNSRTGLSAADKTFIKKAAEGGLAEVELGQLAAQKASSPEVKQFGQRMVDDHSKANDQLKQVASQKGVTVPDKLTAKDAATKAKLEKLSGEAFDRAYMKDMVSDHTKDVSEFQDASQTARDPDVKDFVSKTLPTLQEHLNQAQSIAPKVAKSGRPGGSH